MKKDNALKFTLTVAASVLLAACGSSGSDNNKPVQKQPTAAQQEAAAKQAAAEAQAKLDAEEAKEDSAVGYKAVNKTKSDFIINGRASNKVSSEAGEAAAMFVQNPEKSLDTLVIAAPKAGDKNSKPIVAYVEDFDFTAQNNGTAKLEHVYVNESTLAGAPRANTKNSFGNITKTATQGTKTAVAYVFEDGRKDYTGVAGRIKANAVKTDTSVAEVYGYRTMPNSANNLPLEDSKLSHVQYGRVTTQLDSQLRHTNSGKKLANEFKKGLNLGKDIDTYVVDYSEFNKDSKEDNYFYRGLDNTTAKSLKAFGFGNEKAGTLTYQGHAVTYGLDHGYHGGDDTTNLPAPTALQGLNPSSAPALVSGTHVMATVDLAKRKVDGLLYDQYKVSGQKDLKKSPLVEFRGTLKANGNVKNGTSDLLYVGEKADNRKGTFNATLFGNGDKMADKVNTELGGAVVSKNGDATKKWGAVFGARNVEQESPNPLRQVEDAPVNP